MPDTRNALTTTAPEAGQTLSVVGDTYRIILASEQSGGTCAVIDMLIPPNGGPGPHSHADIQESFYVLEGEIEVQTDARTYTARKDAFVHIPLGGPVHSFKNRTKTTAHLLCTVMPAWMDQMFTEIGKPVAPGTFLPPTPPTEEEQKQLQTIAEKYGQKLYPPNYFDKP